MAWLKSKSGELAAGYRGLLDIMVALCTERHVASAVATVGGSGYAVGDIIDEADSTVQKFMVQAQIDSGNKGTGYAVDDVLTVAGAATTSATMKVTKVTGGAIDDLIVVEAGNYTVAPVLVDNVVTGGTGTGAKVDLIFRDRNKAQFEVLTLSGSAVATVKVVSCGIYAADLTGAKATAKVTGGGDDACTLTMTFADAGWTIERSNIVTDPNGNANEREVILNGEGVGSDNIYVGVQTFISATETSARTWALKGYTGFLPGLTVDGQPGVSSTGVTDGCFVPLTETAVNLDYWFSVDSFRIIMVAKSGLAYPNMYMGFLTPFATTTEYPYPLFIEGCSNIHTTLITTSDFQFGGLTNPIGNTNTGATGPGELRLPGGAWFNVMNQGSSDIRSVTNRNVLPAGDIAITTTGADLWYSTTSGYKFQEFIPDDNNNPTKKLMPSPSSGWTSGGDPKDPDPLYPMFPATIIVGQPVEERQLLGEMPGVFWFPAGTPIVPEDTMTIGTDVYRLFPNCNKSDQFNFVAVKEE